MSKFKVDPETLGWVSNALVALEQDLRTIATSTRQTPAVELGGESVLASLETFDAEWQQNRDVVADEIDRAQAHLTRAEQAYALIEQEVAQGATGVIDLGGLGWAIINRHDDAENGHATTNGHGGADHGPTRGTTTIG